jgi:hypothetical protein
LVEDLKRRQAAQAKYEGAARPPAALPPAQVSQPVAPPAARPAKAPPATPPATSTPRDSSPTPPGTYAGAMGAPTRDESWWKQQMKSLQAVLDDASARLAEAEKLNFKYGYNDAQVEYKKRAAAVEQARQAVDRLRDEARRAGVPPAWLRP